MNTTAWYHTELFCYKMVLLARTSFLIILISENIQIVHNRDILVSFTVVVIRYYLPLVISGNICSVNPLVIV
jgi:hypothetical protein